MNLLLLQVDRNVYFRRDIDWFVTLIAWLAPLARPGCLQVDEDLLQQQQEAYRVQGVDEDELITAAHLKKKRKQGTADEVS